jgi:uncharacterized membrane protein
VPVEVSRDGKVLTSGAVVLRAGQGSLRFTDRVSAPGAHRYSVRLLPESDGRSGNNIAESWIEIIGGPRLLLVTSYTDDPLARTLRAQGFDVQIVSDLAGLNLGHLSGTKGVILDNVPAYSIPADFLSALDLYVRVQGGGLLMVGGKFSFGSGGYFGSAIDELLPVSMELRTEHRKLAVAMAVVMDRSGSMAASVAGGVTKMDLANEGVARAIELLGPNDAVSVLAVDSEPHIVVPLTKLGKNREDIDDRVRRITSGGGGIYVYVGLKAAWEELKKSDAGQRHVVLFSDAADSEEPGEYKTLIDEMLAGGATISVIGLGSTLDPDAELLQDIAARGKGRIFFNADASSLPGLFAQETVALARSAFLDEPVKLTPGVGWMEIAAKPLEWLEAVDGYNLSYLKPDATGAAFSGDEYAAPLIAFWQRGAGRAAAVSFPLGGEFSQRVREWPGYGDFTQTLGRWLMGDELPPGLGLRTRVDGSELRLDLLYDDTWEQRLTQNAPQIVVAEGPAGKPTTLVWQRIEPGHFTASMPLEAGRAVSWCGAGGEFHGAVSVRSSRARIQSGTWIASGSGNPGSGAGERRSGARGPGEDLGSAATGRVLRSPPWLVVALLLVFMAMPYSPASAGECPICRRWLP